jgi:hypothetical protein
MDSVDARLLRLEGRFDDLRDDVQGLRTEIRHVDDRMSRQFMWLVGIMLTMFLAMMAMFNSVISMFNTVLSRLRP